MGISIWKPAGWFRDYLDSLTQAFQSPQKLVLGLILLNLCITIPLAMILNIWFDEAYTLATTGQTVGHAVRQALYFEEQAPLYFMLMTLWRKLDSSIFFARLFSAFSISATLYVASLISQRLFKQVHPAWVVTALALNPFMIWAAVEIRLFAFSILLSALALLYFIRGYLEDSPRARWIHLLIAIVSLYTHYFLAFTLVTYGITLLCLQKYRAFSLYGRFMIVVGISFLPMLLGMISTQQVSAWHGNPTTAHYSFSLFENLRTSFGAMLLYLLPAEVGENSPNSWRLLRLLLLALLLTLGVVHRRSMQLQTAMILIFTAVLATLFFVAFELFNRLGLNDSIQHYRHTTSLLIPTLFSVVAVFALVQHRQSRRRRLTVWLSALLVFYLTSIYLTFSPLAKAGDYIRVASYLMQQEQENQAILVFNPEVEMALSHYYRGMNQLVALPKPEEFQVYDLSQLLLKSEQEIFDAIAKIAQPERLWLVTDTDSIKTQPDYQQSYQILDDFLRQHTEVKSSQDFHGTNVKLLHLAAL